MCCPGATDEKAAVLKQLTHPTTYSMPESASNESQKFWAAARRCKQFGMDFPDVTVLYRRSFPMCYRTRTTT
eukprot:12332416-Prorocentrum_lima.AAC.1